MWADRPKEEIPGRGDRNQRHWEMYLLIFWVYTEDLEPWGELVEMMMVVEV